MSNLHQTSGVSRQINFVPVRWWQAIDFVRTNFEMVQGYDPEADRILSQPWALSSLLEYGYALAGFPPSDPFFITISGKRAGILWLTRRSDLVYVLSLGLFSDFRTSQVGMLTARTLVKATYFIEEYFDRHKCETLVMRIHVDNIPIQRFVKTFDCRPLGLATTRLELLDKSFSTSSSNNIVIKRVNRTQAVKSWKRRRLNEVEQVSGPLGVSVTTQFLKSFGWIESLPRGQYLTLHRDNQEIGLVYTQQRKGELTLGLFTSDTFYSGAQTAKLLDTLSAHLNATIHHLILTKRHADILTESAPFNYERHREKERLTLFRMAKPRLRPRPNRQNQ